MEGMCVVYLDKPCSGLNRVLQKEMLMSQNPVTCERALIWKLGLCTCNEGKGLERRSS